MNGYSRECLQVFLGKQEQLFDEPVAETEEEAAEFLEECMAQVFPSLREARKYLDAAGMDVTGMTEEELLSQAEIFPLPDGSCLVVEG